MNWNYALSENVSDAVSHAVFNRPRLLEITRAPQLRLKPQKYFVSEM